MSRQTVTLRGRVAAEQGMLDTVQIQHKTGEVTDPDLGTVTPTYATVYAGKAKVQQGGVPVGQPKDLGEASVQITHLQLHVPVSVTGIQVDDIATVTASTLDADLVGRVFTIRSVAHKSFLTARRMDIEEIES